MVFGFRHRSKMRILLRLICGMRIQRVGKFALDETLQKPNEVRASLVRCSSIEKLQNGWGFRQIEEQITKIEIP